MAPPSEPARGARGNLRAGGVLGIAAVVGLLAVGGQPGDEPRSIQAEPSHGGAPPTTADAVASPAASVRIEPSVSAAPAEPVPALSTAPAASSAEVGWDVPRVATPLDEVSVARVLRRAHELELGEPPSDLRLGVAWAHIALENARGKGIECNNFGNLSVWEREPGPRFVRNLTERRRATYDSRFGPFRLVEMRFRAFERPIDGARAYWAHLQAHYALALQLFNIGDGHVAGLKLARDGYATTHSDEYASSIANLTLEFKVRILPQL